MALNLLIHTGAGSLPVPLDALPSGGIQGYWIYFLNPKILSYYRNWKERKPLREAAASGRSSFTE
jgi:hypothetical protein